MSPAAGLRAAGYYQRVLGIRFQSYDEQISKPATLGLAPTL